MKNSLLLMRLAEVLDMPVVLTSQYKKGLGEILPEVRAAAPGNEPLDKVAFGCFGDAAFLDRLRSLPGRDQLLVTGVEGHICVCQTVLGALEKGYDVHVAADAVGSRSEENYRVGLARMERSGALLSERGDGDLRAPGDGATARPSRRCCRTSRSDVRLHLPALALGGGVSGTAARQVRWISSKDYAVLDAAFR